MKKNLLLFTALIFLLIACTSSREGIFFSKPYEHKGQLLYWVNATPSLGGIYVGRADGSGSAKKILFNPYSADAVAIDAEEKRLYYTNMTLLSRYDGNVMRADIVGDQIENITPVVPNGMGLRTPKQLILDKKNRKIYFADREGRRIYRVSMDGFENEDELEVLVDFTSKPEDQHQFVGVALDSNKSEFYWTDRLTNTIWRASSNLGLTITLKNLSQYATPILTYEEGMLLELDLDHVNHHLYFTDRGEGNEFFGETLPAGFVGRVDLNNLAAGYEVVVPNLLKDPVGLAISPESGYLYFSTSEDGKIFRRPLQGGDVEQIHQGRPFCEGMYFVDWDKSSPIEEI